MRLELRHAVLLPLTIYLHYALREAPCLTQFHLANLCLLSIGYYSVCSHANYMASFYPFVNRDLLITGAFCHDIDKFQEYTFTQMGLVSDYSDEGSLLGHPYMGAVEIHDIGRALNISEEKILLLQHLLLSHHGKLEYGAAVLPKTAEAMLLSMLDDLDAKLEVCRKALEDQEHGMSKDKIYPFGYKIYKT